MTNPNIWLNFSMSTMDENEILNLDVEFKRYLQILRPYLEKLINHEIIGMCNSWIQRLSSCNENEKPLRNKYVFALCYQVARGFIDDPFIRDPPNDALPPMSDDLNSEDSSTEIEYLVIDSEEPTTKLLFSNKNPNASDTENVSQENEYVNDKGISRESFSNNKNSNDEKYITDNPTRKQTVLCYTCPEMLVPHRNYENPSEECENRAITFIRKLRDIKAQNRVLQDELITLKKHSKKPSYLNEEQLVSKLNNTSSVCAYVHRNDSSATLKSLNCKLHELQDSRNNLIETIANLQDKVQHFEEMKKHEINDIEAKHKLNIIKIKTSVQEEAKNAYEKKAEELKHSYEAAIKEIEDKYQTDIVNLTTNKDDTIATKNNEITEKDVELVSLKSQLEDQKNKFNVVLSKFLENSGDDFRNDSFKYKSEQLEKRLIKIENSKVKCIKAYETKIACLQREKHFAECSLQLQLSRQRAQVVNEVTDESQAEITTALDKLESKYKDIVANVQATAIYRGMQDQIALKSILQAACGIPSEACNSTNNQFTGKIPHNQNQSCDTEISSLYAANKVGSKSLGENSLVTGYRLNGERMGQLFDRVYVPQRDNGEPLK